MINDDFKTDGFGGVYDDANNAEKLRKFFAALSEFDSQISLYDTLWYKMNLNVRSLLTSL